MKISLLLKKRVTLIEETIIFLNTLITEIEFSKRNVFEIFSVLSSEASMKNLPFLKSFGKSEEHSDFHSLWIKSINSTQSYKSEEKEKLLQLGNFLGTTDAKSQINTIRLYTVFFENYREKAVYEYEKYGKVSPLFGLFAGACIFILLI